MKILLIYPYCLEERLQADDINVPPIGIYYVAALLMEHQYDIEVLNWYDINRNPQKIKETLAREKADVIGFSILHANRWGAIEISRLAKEVDPDVKIVFGGVGATFLWEHLLLHFKDIDFIVIGEGEHTFLNIVKCIEEGKYVDIEKIKGIAFRNEGEIIRTEDAEVVQDLDSLPVPAKYFEYQHVSSTRGCPGSCTFCGSSQFWGHKVRFHSPGYFVDQLELLYKKGITFFYFSDDIFTIKKSRVIRICKEILKRDLKIVWVAISRVNYVNEEILYWMGKAGCIQISYGVESGSEKIRNRMLNKNISTDDIKRAFAMTTKFGMLARAYFIYGSPGESWDTIEETIDLIREIKPLSIIFYILDIFPGTALYSDFKRRSGITDDIWLRQIEDIMFFETDPHMSKELILAFGQRLRTKYYEMLHSFVDAIDLAEDEALCQIHSEFLSRLGMTFTHGDYASIDAIKKKEKIAERLFSKSLDCYPDHRAYLGLGIIKQKERNYKESVRILSEGAECFPDSEPLNICLGISHMNLGDPNKALLYFLSFQDSSDAVYYAAKCYEALGDLEKEATFRKKLQSLQQERNYCTRSRGK